MLPWPTGAAVRALLGRLGPLGALAAVLVVFAVRNEAFASFDNLRTVLLQAVLVALAAIGMTFVTAIGGIDLSVGAVLALAAVATALLRAAELPLWLAAGGGIGVGALVGAGNGALVAWGGLPPFLVTLGSLGMARGAAKWLAAERTVSADAGWLPAAMAKFPEPGWLLLAPGVWLLFGLAGAASWVLTRSVFGRHCHALGGNPLAARQAGVAVPKVQFTVYVVCGALAGLAGVLHFGRVRVGDPTAGAGLELQAIAAVVLGGGSLAGGAGTIHGSLLGAFGMALLANGCTLEGLPTYVQEVLVGAIIVGAVAVDRWRRGHPQH